LDVNQNIIIIKILLPRCSVGLPYRFVELLWLFRLVFHHTFHSSQASVLDYRSSSLAQFFFASSSLNRQIIFAYTWAPVRPCACSTRTRLDRQSLLLRNWQSSALICASPFRMMKPSWSIMCPFGIVDKMKSNISRTNPRRKYLTPFDKIECCPSR